MRKGTTKLSSGGFVAIAVKPHSPAANADVQHGDRVVEINGVPVLGAPLTRAVSMALSGLATVFMLDRDEESIF